MYKSVRYNNMPSPVRQRQEIQPEKESKAVVTEGREENKTKKPVKEQNDAKCGKQSVLPDNLETDDLVLLIVAFVLLMDGCDDKLLLAAIAFIFLSDC